MKKSMVYTRTGDKGLTSLVGGKRVPKQCLRIEAYGTIDELNSFIGLLLSDMKDEKDVICLNKIQQFLFTVGAYLATEENIQDKTNFCEIKSEYVQKLESEIDRIDELLPPLKAFILPGGCKEAGKAHVCRTVCRRAERVILRLAETVEISSDLIAYINRLSDYFFVLARKLNIEAGYDEIIWNKH